MTELVLCSSPSPFAGGEPCPLERDHDGGHVYWTQTRPDRKRGRNGVWVVDEDGKTLLHATFDGAVRAEKVCALLALPELVNRAEAKPSDEQPECPGHPAAEV